MDVIETSQPRWGLTDRLNKFSYKLYLMTFFDGSELASRPSSYLGAHGCVMQSPLYLSPRLVPHVHRSVASAPVLMLGVLGDA